MSSSIADSGTILATDVKFGAERLHVALSDGRVIGVPLDWFPRLNKATSQQRERWELIGRGIGLHWPDIDEDLSVAGLLAGNRSQGIGG
jgi:hypothetical protein